MEKTQPLSSRWRGAMRSHFEAAEFRAANAVWSEALAGGARPDYDDELLHARILLKEDEEHAVAFLIRRPPNGKSEQQRGEWALLLAIGYARMGDFERSDHHFALAKKGLKKAPERAQLAYQMARRLLLEGRTDDARRHAEQMSVDRTLATRISKEMLDSFILCHEERYRQSAESLIRAIGLIGKNRDHHWELYFHAVQNLALLGRELAFDEAAQAARREVDQDVEWPDDFRTQRFQALKAVGWSCALRGDMLGCFRYLRAAERVIPSKAFEAILLLDRAYFAQISGEKNWACNEVIKAEAIADEIDWNALQGDERVGLLLLAEAVARVDAEKGRYYLARYKRLDRMRSSLLLFAFDNRLAAMAAYAEGVVRLASDDANAEQPLREAWSTFDRIGYDWRAARAALRLRAVTGKERWRHLAEDKLEAFPNSWLAHEVRPSSEKSGKQPIKLPPMQAKVLAMLCKQLTTEEIATALGLSPHTVRNHLKAVFRAYGVRNRAALVAEAAMRGELVAGEASRPAATAVETA